MEAEKVVLEYKRKISEGDRCTGAVVVTDKGVELVRHSFSKIPFKEMLNTYIKYVQDYPTADCFYKRVDREGLAEMPWAPAHVAAMRGAGKDALVDALNNPPTFGKEIKNA